VGNVVIRVARRPATTAGNQRELAILPRLAGRLPVKVPVSIAYAEPSTALPFGAIRSRCCLDRSRHSTKPGLLVILPGSPTPFRPCTACLQGHFGSLPRRRGPTFEETESESWRLFCLCSRRS
jgi:hypothetical protein